MTHYFRNAFLSIGNLNISAILGSKTAQETDFFFSLPPAHSPHRRFMIYHHYLNYHASTTWRGFRGGTI